MAIGPIELQGTVLRTQDYTQLKHQEDTRGVVDQSHFQDQLKKDPTSTITRMETGKRRRMKCRNRGAWF